MADDPNPQLRASLNAALNVVTPEVRGLIDLLALPRISSGLHDSLMAALQKRQFRENLLQTAISGLDAVVQALANLEEDGYPSLDPISLPSDQLAELQGDAGDLNAAVSVFSATLASQIQVNLGQPVSKEAQP